MVAVAKVIRALLFSPWESKANIGGAASAPVVAAAFHPRLLPSVYCWPLSDIPGTYGAYITLMMQAVAPS